MDPSIAPRAVVRINPPAPSDASRQTEQDRALARANRVCTGLQERLFELEAALRAAEERRAFDAAAGAEHLARRHAEFTASLTQAAQSRDALARQLQDTAAALDETRELRAAEAASSAAHLARREAELGASLSAAEAARTELEDALAQARHSLRETLELAAAERATDAQAAEARERELSGLLAQESAARKSLSRTLAETQSALEESRRARTREADAAAERLQRREAELSAMLQEAEAGRAAMEQARAQEQAAHRLTRERATSDLTAAAAREAALEERLARQTDAQQALERTLDEARLASARTRRRLLDVAAAIRQRARGHRAALDAEMARQRTNHDRVVEGWREELRQALLARESLAEALDDARLELRRAHEAADEERQRQERVLAALDSERQRLSADYTQALQALEQLRSAFASLEVVSSQHAAERALLEKLLAERDTQLSDVGARHLAAEDTVVELRRQLVIANKDLHALRLEAETLRGSAQRIPALQQQIDNALAEQRSVFERAPFGLCRCTRDGSITRVNGALVSLLGYRSPDELRTVDFASAVFECPGDLQWLIERTPAEGATDWVDTTWITRNRRRIAVRLQLQTAPDGAIEIAVNDVSGLRAAEEKARQAHRIEAVGRLASEVAATCETVLADVTRNGRDYLAALDPETSLRQQGEMLMSEVARAASFLRQLAVYGDRQVRVSDSVSVPRILRDLAAVLKRVAGDDIELVLPRAASTDDIVVDVDAERVERILVNVASYARERMPHGGRVKIDVSTTKADRRFVARYPNVRPGSHAVIGVTEVRADFPASSQRRSPHRDHGTETPGSSEKPGVDLGALLALVAGCGGHLWMSADPPGNMTLKIHLPRKIDDAPAGVALVAPVSPGRSLVRWFRH